MGGALDHWLSGNNGASKRSRFIKAFCTCCCRAQWGLMKETEKQTQKYNNKNPPLLGNGYVSNVPCDRNFILHGFCSHLSGKRQELTLEERTFTVSTTVNMSAKGKKKKKEQGGKRTAA